LVVDDEEFIGSALRRVLFGYDVTSTTSGQQALDRIREGDRFDAVVLDVHMPGLNGYEFVRQLATLSPELAQKVLFLTADASVASRVSDRPVLSKPIEMHSLRAALEKVAAPSRLSKPKARVNDTPTRPVLEAVDPSNVPTMRPAQPAGWTDESPTQPARKNIAVLDSPDADLDD
jgi:CheY-like chemotaxis protein